MRMRYSSWAIALALLLPWSQAATAAPDGYKPLGTMGDVVVTLELKDDQTANVVFHTAIQSEIQEKVSAIHLWADGDLSSLQSKAQSIVGRRASWGDCADLVSLSDVSLVAEGAHAQLCGQVTYEHRQCARVRVPMFEGTRTTYQDMMVARATLSQETGEICAALVPEPDSTNKSFVLKHEVTKHELSDTLASLPHPVDLEQKFYGESLQEAFAALTDAAFPTPKPLAKYDPSVLETQFEEGPDGALLMTAEELVPVPEGDIADLIIELLECAGQCGAGAGT
jgi:hypothetical protein